MFHSHVAGKHFVAGVLVLRSRRMKRMREELMLRISVIALVMAMTLPVMMGVGARAQESTSSNTLTNTPTRFTFNQVTDGFLRLDNQTGQVTLCSQHSVGWACEAVPEDRAALEMEIGRLQDEVSSLKAELAALKSSAGKSGEIKLKMPSKDDVARARVFIEDTWRNLVDMISTMQKDMMRKG
jgi:hypothetical protein